LPTSAAKARNAWRDGAGRHQPAAANQFERHRLGQHTVRLRQRHLPFVAARQPRCENRRRDGRQIHARRISLDLRRRAGDFRVVEEPIHAGEVEGKHGNRHGDDAAENPSQDPFVRIVR
jgi:hypothetical protein